MKRAGMALVSVLMLAAIAALAAFTLAAVVVSGLHMAAREVNSRKAVFLAEAAVTDTIAQIHTSLVNQSAPFGANVTVPLPGSPSCMGQVTFNTRANIPYSVNNVQGSGPVAGYYPGSQVPAGDADVIATGTVNGATRSVEALVSVPPFPYALSVSGPFTCNGDLSVTAASTMAAAASPAPGPTAAMPASLGSNATVTVTGSMPANISGNVVAPGSVSLPPGSTVGGQIEQKSVLIPTISVAGFDPGPSYPAPAPTPGGLLVNQWCYEGSGLTVPGNLYLNNGALYVYGDLKVTGGVSGTGDIFVTGKTTISGGANVDANTLVALLSDGDVTLSGTGVGQKYFQGLVYTQGKFTASNITIMGAFVASGAGASMTLTNAPVVYVPAAVTIAPVGPASSWLNVDGNGNLLNPGNGNPLNLNNWQWTVTSVAGSGSPQETAIENSMVAAFGGNADFNSYLSFSTQYGNVIALGAVTVTGTDGNIYTLQVSETGYTQTGSVFTGTQNWQTATSPTITFTRQSSPTSQTTTISQAVFDAQVSGGIEHYNGGLGYTAAPNTPVTVSNLSSRLIPLMKQMQQQYMALVNQYAPASGGGHTAPPMPNLTINNFLGDPDPVQVVFWRDR